MTRCRTPRRSPAAWGALLALVATTTVALAAPGDPDGSFGYEGKVVTRSLLGSDATATARSVAEQADGKLVAAGIVTDPVGEPSLTTTFYVTVHRYHPSGALDGTFGPGGRVVTFAGSDEHDHRSGAIGGGGEAVAVQVDGRIVVAGWAWVAPDRFSHTERRIAVVRYWPDGTLDESFGTDGVATPTVVPSTSSEAAQALVIQPDGKIVVAGHGQVSGGSDDYIGLVRLDATGAPDPTFGGGDGAVVTPEGNYASALVLLPDGRLVAGGARGGRFLLAAYLPDGTPDPEFDGGDPEFGAGIATAGFAFELYPCPARARVEGLAVSDDKLVAVGPITDPQEGDVHSGISGHHLDGSLDTTFEGDGRVVAWAPGAGPSDTCPQRSSRPPATDLRAVDVGVDGTVTAAGIQRVEDGGTARFLLERFEVDGSRDEAFGAGGRAATPFATCNAFGNALVRTQTGRLVTAGSASPYMALTAHSGGAAGTRDASVPPAPPSRGTGTASGPPPPTEWECGGAAPPSSSATTTASSGASSGGASAGASSGAGSSGPSSTSPSGTGGVVTGTFIADTGGSQPNTQMTLRVRPRRLSRRGGRLVVTGHVGTPGRCSRTVLVDVRAATRRLARSRVPLSASCRYVARLRLRRTRRLLRARSLLVLARFEGNARLRPARRVRRVPLG